MSLDVLGKWAFLLGLVVAVIAAFVSSYGTTMLLVLFVLGLVVGFLNITEKNTVKFLIAVVALLTMGIASISALSVLGVVINYLGAILGNFIAFVGASALIVSIKAIVETSKA